ncbi:hypothetical protein B0H14DRAFT_3673018 [Mycena olivaceomarginata]|nr:hypothetical protein B0H14DRAFT_3673018 [Mycena olivaceomarginata]
MELLPLQGPHAWRAWAASCTNLGYNFAGWTNESKGEVRRAATPRRAEAAGILGEAAPHASQYKQCRSREKQDRIPKKDQGAAFLAARCLGDARGRRGRRTFLAAGAALATLEWAAFFGVFGAALALAAGAAFLPRTAWEMVSKTELERRETNSFGFWLEGRLLSGGFGLSSQLLLAGGRRLDLGDGFCLGGSGCDAD